MYGCYAHVFLINLWEMLKSLYTFSVVVGYNRWKHNRFFSSLIMKQIWNFLTLFVYPSRTNKYYKFSYSKGKKKNRENMLKTSFFYMVWMFFINFHSCHGDKLLFNWMGISKKYFIWRYLGVMYFLGSQYSAKHFSATSNLNYSFSVWNVNVY